MEPTTAAPVAVWVAERAYWIFLGVMILNIIQRRYQKQVEKKRFATLIIGIALFGVLVAGHAVNEFNGTDWMFYLAVAGIVAVLVYYREKTFPFRFRSQKDGRWLTFQEILFDDEHGDGDEEHGGGQDDGEEEAENADAKE
jgi:peptidoglycan/LPS O-acetylase OafA/YrhL